MASNRGALIALLVVGASLRAADRDVSIDSVAVSAKPWRWTVFLKGTPDVLAHVRCVQYVLDPSFPNPHRTVCDRGVQDRPFATRGATWGTFKLLATVTFDDKTVQQLQYTLNPPAPVSSFNVEPGLNRIPGDWLPKPTWIAIALLPSYDVAQPPNPLAVGVGSAAESRHFIWVILTPKKSADLDAQRLRAVGAVVEAARTGTGWSGLTKWLNKYVTKAAPPLDTILCGAVSVTQIDPTTGAAEPYPEWSSDVTIGKQTYTMSVQPQGTATYAVAVYAKAK
jgi:hypothetical protein